jgi:hypothetical protein
MLARGKVVKTAHGFTGREMLIVAVFRVHSWEVASKFNHSMLSADHFRLCCPVATTTVASVVQIKLLLLKGSTREDWSLRD